MRLPPLALVSTSVIAVAALLSSSATAEPLPPRSTSERSLRTSAPSENGDDDRKVAKRKRRKKKREKEEKSKSTEKEKTDKSGDTEKGSNTETAPDEPSAEESSAKEMSSTKVDEPPPNTPGDDDKSEFDEALPFFHSFRRAEGFGGKVGLGVIYLGQQNGPSTGYGLLFGQVDGRFGDSGFGIHIDGDVRVSAFGSNSLFEPRNPLYFNRLGMPSNAEQANAGTNNRPYYGDVVESPGQFYRQPGTFVTGRTNDYLRIQSLNITYDTASFGGTLGRMFIVSAAQAQVDGLEGHFVLEGLGSVGAFAGFKPNPWNQQVVGASSGGFVLDPNTGDYIQARWGRFDADPLLSFGGGTLGAYSNEIGLGQQWVQFLSLRHATVGGYGNLRLSSLFLDFALVLDVFTNLEFNPDVVAIVDDNDIEQNILDRLWFHTTGGTRLLDNLTLSWRATIDLAGARVLTPRDAFIDLTWRDLGPVTLSATYYKVNTYATATSFFRFFRPLENPNYAADFANPEAGQIDFADPGTSAILASAGLNNTSLFLVDRDRLRAEASVEIVGALQVYAQGQLERRGDAIYTPTEIGDAYGAFGDGLGNLGNILSDPTSLCFVDVDKQATGTDGRPLAYQGQTGINPTVPVSQDLCRWGGSVGIRDPFLANVGSFDLKLTHMNGYAQSTTRVGGNVGAGLFGALWFQVGGSVELNTNERTFGLYDSVPDANTRTGMLAFYSTQTNVYSLNTAVTWNVIWGLFVEAAYTGFIEDLPYQGVREINGAAYIGEEIQVLHSFSGRALWRF